MHQHGPSDNHHHHHGPSTYNGAFLVSIIANGLFVLLQIIFAYLAHSTSLLADAFHNLGDVLSLVLAWVATGLMQRKPTQFATYGMKKTSILAALVNGLVLVFTCGIIATEAMYKFFHETSINAVSVMIVAGIGIVVNGATAMLFMKGSDDLNIRGAFLHLLYDALISLGVVVSAALIYWTGWLWIDPVVGLLIAFIILKGTWTLFTDSFRLIIDAVPRSVSLTEVQKKLLAIDGVCAVHDLHIWAMSTQENALSAHLHIPDGELTDKARASLVASLKKEYGIQHITIQVEQDLSFCDDACHSIN